MHSHDIGRIADRLIASFDTAAQIESISKTDPGFDVDAGYAVLLEIETRRIRGGWRPVGRKLGFTNRTIWERYGVDRPMWSRIWSHTVHDAPSRVATLSLSGFMEPRLEPEVVFRIAAPVPATDDADAILDAVDAIAPGFEIVQTPFPHWRFTAADVAAACALHGALVVGRFEPLDAARRRELARKLPSFEATLSRGASVIDRGIGAHVLDSPALALAHLVRGLADRTAFPPLVAGEIVTTGTLTDAAPVKMGEAWSSDYGDLGLAGLTITFA